MTMLNKFGIGKGRPTTAESEELWKGRIEELKKYYPNRNIDKVSKDVMKKYYWDMMKEIKANLKDKYGEKVADKIVLEEGEPKPTPEPQTPAPKPKTEPQKTEPAREVIIKKDKIKEPPKPPEPAPEPESTELEIKKEEIERKKEPVVIETIPIFEKE